MKELGVIGFGRFGQLAAKHLAAHFKVSVFDVDESKEKIAREKGVAFAPLEECCSKPFVVFCVPIRSFRKALEDAKPFLSRDALVFDTCSVKIMPCKAMQEIQCESVGTHPLFGPDTAGNGIKGNKIALCPVRTKRLDKIKGFLEGELGLEAIITTPEEHDKQMAYSLALKHVLGKALKDVGVKDISLSTPGHTAFLKLIEIACNDSQELMEDMQLYNPYATEARKRLVRKLGEIDDELDVKGLMLSEKQD